MLELLIKKSRTLDRLMELGTKHAVQSSLYDLENEGFITRKIKAEKETNVYYYIFNRNKLLFKIQKDIEDKSQRFQDIMKFYSSNYLFFCQQCEKLYEYAEAMEQAFKCCNDQQMQSFDTTEILQKITKNMAYLNDKLQSLAKI
jgi:transcription initiation factor IIE alpha subunit